MICIGMLLVGVAFVKLLVSVGIGISTVSRSLHAILYHMARRGHVFIRFPRPVNDLRRIKQGFYGTATLSNVSGAVDGAFIVGNALCR